MKRRLAGTEDEYRVSSTEHRAAKRRKNAAHGESRGWATFKNEQSPEGAQETQRRDLRCRQSNFTHPFPGPGPRPSPSAAPKPCPAAFRTARPSTLPRRKTPGSKMSTATGIWTLPAASDARTPGIVATKLSKR